MFCGGGCEAGFDARGGGNIEGVLLGERCDFRRCVGGGDPASNRSCN